MTYTKKLTIRSWRPAFVALLLLVLSTASQPLAAQETTQPASAAEQQPATQDESRTDESRLVQVNWIDELVEGGMTVCFLGLLSVGLLAWSLERLLMLRAKRFVPRGLAHEIAPKFAAGEFDEILEACEKNPSALGRVIAYLVHHRDADSQLLMQAAGDLGAREIVDQEQRNVPFAVIAALAPLLGLLGTMIGMIEAFKLVEIFGDEGGASMLAGSISKALITTAVGLILAIPAISLYHFFKHRVHKIAQRLEAETELLFSAWFVRKQAIKVAMPETSSHDS